MNKDSILDMPDDLLDDAQPKQRSKSQVVQSRHVTNQRNPPESGSALDASVSETANTLGIAVEELANWTQEVIVSKDVLKSILTTAKRYKLNPLLGQIDWEANLEGGYEVYIPIDGWIAMIHRQPTFQGIAFDQSPETEHGIPIWMECTIYRSDLAHPISVREYYAELKTEHPMWSQMPRRMLRHKTLQQCARLTFGITVPELKIPFMPTAMEKLVAVHSNQSPLNRKAILRQKLIRMNF
jgi:RecT family